MVPSHRANSHIRTSPLRGQGYHYPPHGVYLETGTRVHPHRNVVHFLLSGIAQGFRICFGYTSIVLSSAKRNLKSALDHPDVVTNYLEAEISESRVVDPLPKHLIPEAHISGFGVISKSHKPGKWCLIVSYPAGRSINDGVPKSLRSMTYKTVDDAIRRIIQLGPGTLLAKIDIRNAFRLLPVHPADRHLLAMEWKGNLYINTCLPFGLTLRSAPKLFNIVADALASIFGGKTLLFRSWVSHYWS